MIDPRRDRLDYGEQLRPPPGYRFDRAIATTYSADLSAILSIPVALVHAHTLEGDFSGTRVELLDAIRRFSERTLIYHQAGRLQVPAKLNWLYAYLEQTLVPVVPADAFTSFHPKCWVLRYAPGPDAAPVAGADPRPLFRVLVLSRNLTFDASWDLAATLEGFPEPDIKAVNAPLVSFLRWLDTQRTDRRCDDDFAAFLDEFARVKLSLPAPFTKARFHPMGKGVPNASPAVFLEQRADQALVLSPFLHPAALARLRERAGKLELYSNRRELTRFTPEQLAADSIYQLADEISDAELESTTSDSHPTDIPRDLHAKLFVFERGDTLRCYLGSANATEAAATRNIELMLELSNAKGDLSVRHLRRLLCGEAKGEGRNKAKEIAGPFVPYEPPPNAPATDLMRHLEQQLRRLKHDIVSASISGAVEREGDTAAYTLCVTAQLRTVDWPGEFAVFVEPFNVASLRPAQRLVPRVEQMLRFSNLGEVEISRFLHFKIEHREAAVCDDFLLCLPPMRGLPEDRLDRILRRLLDSPEKFLGYLKFLLAEEVTKAELQGLSSPLVGHNGSAGSAALEMPLFEQLLVASSRNPERLREVDKLIRSLTEEASDVGGGAPAPDRPAIVPPEFLKLWLVFRRASADTSRR